MSIFGWFAYSYHKVFPQEKVRENPTGHIYAARGEYESCQFVVKSEKAADNIVVSVSPFTNVAGDQLTAELFEVHYIHIGCHGVWPDPILPLEGKLSLKAGEAKAVYIRIKTELNTAPGNYTTGVEVNCGGEVFYYPLKLTVWDFCLPKTPYCQTAFGIRKDTLEDIFGLEKDSEESQELYAKFYEELLEHKVSAYDLPVDLLSEDADRYLNDTRMTSFRIPYVEKDEEQNRYFAKLRQNKKWFSKAYFYTLDEPSSQETYERMDRITERLSRLEPNFRQVIPFYMNPQFDIRLSAVESMMGKVKVWCPESCAWDDLNGCDKIGRGKDNTLGPKMAARQAAGETVWWYVCCGPRQPYCNLYIHQEGICHRILFWQQRQKNVDGLLYWCTTWWSKQTGTADPWTDMATVKEIDPDLYGDGSLFYNGNKFGRMEPISSLRLEAIRDGIEDYDYLTMAMETLGQEYTEYLMREVTTSLTEYTTDEDAFYQIRIRLGNALQNALQKK